MPFEEGTIAQEIGFCELVVSKFANSLPSLKRVLLCTKHVCFSVCWTATRLSLGSWQVLVTHSLTSGTRGHKLPFVKHPDSSILW